MMTTTTIKLELTHDNDLLAMAAILESEANTRFTPGGRIASPRSRNAEYKWIPSFREMLISAAEQIREQA